jgi:hypothetical protein
MKSYRIPLTVEAHRRRRSRNQTSRGFRATLAGVPDFRGLETLTSYRHLRVNQGEVERS